MRGRERMQDRAIKAGDKAIDRDMAGLLKPIYDKQLGLKLPPHAKGHDTRGWRNTNVPEHADIVAIGDSQTWGINVQLSDAWPQALAGMTHWSTYNMALGYYGPIEYLALLDEALQLSPKVVIVGLYFGNDFWGAYHTVYFNDAYASWRDPTASEALRTDMIGPRADELAREWATHALQESGATAAEGRQWHLEELALGRLLVQSGFWSRRLVLPHELLRLKAWAQAFPEHGTVYEQGPVCTVMTTAYRLLAEDLNDIRIKEGMRLTQKALTLMQLRTRQSNAQLVVLLIPTKEFVYASVMKERHGGGAIYEKLVEQENEGRRQVIITCREAGIVIVDPLPPLCAAVLRNESIYPADVDGHPNRRGYYLFASTVRDVLGDGVLRNFGK